MSYFIGDQYLFNGSVALIGSSGILYNSSLGNKIDLFDNVVRFNRAPTDGFEKDVGNKTTLRVVNNHVFLNLPANPLFTNQPVNFVRDLRNTDIMFVGPHMVKQEDKLKHTDKSNNFYIFDYNKINELKKVAGFDNEKNPSVGCVLIILCVISGIVPNLFGFDLNKTGIERSHYFESRPPVSGVHNIDYEKEFLNSLLINGKIIVNI